MKSNDYEKWLNNYKNRIKENNNVYQLKVNNSDDIYGYYEWNKEAFESDHIKANVTVSVSDSLFDRFETALARVDLALDKLLAYLHEQKNI